MNKQLQPEQIRQLLNRSIAQMDQPTLARLRDARTQALARHEARSQAPAFALAGLWPGHGHATGSQQKHYHWAAVILFAACLFSGAAYWQHANKEHDIGEVDVAILTDDLPIEIYVD